MWASLRVRNFGRPVLECSPDFPGDSMFLMVKSEEKFPAGSGRWGQKAIILRCAQNILYDKSLL